MIIVCVITAASANRVPLVRCPPKGGQHFSSCYSFSAPERSAFIQQRPVSVVFCSFSYYAGFVYVGIKFNRAAFRHGVTEVDILRAFETYIYEDPVDDADNKYLLLGFDLRGNLIEVMYNRINEDAINVFHAMPCRKAFHNLVEL